MSQIVGRFAPTPSGRMHLGNVFAALIAWLSVRSRGGSLVLRMEDLDTQRTSAEFAQLLRDDLLWLGLDWTKKPLPNPNEAALISNILSGCRIWGFCTPATAPAASCTVSMRPTCQMAPMYMPVPAGI